MSLRSKRLDSIILIKIIRAIIIPLPCTIHRHSPSFNLYTSKSIAKRKKEEERIKVTTEFHPRNLHKHAENSKYSSSSILGNPPPSRETKLNDKIFHRISRSTFARTFRSKDGHDPEMVRGRRRSPKWSGEPWIPSSGLGCTRRPRA